jgi:hypothetical protein
MIVLSVFFWGSVSYPGRRLDGARLISSPECAAACVTDAEPCGSGFSALFLAGRYNSQGWPKIWASTNPLIGICTQNSGSTCEFWVTPVNRSGWGAWSGRATVGEQRARVCGRELLNFAQLVVCQITRTTFPLHSYSQSCALRAQHHARLGC